MPLLRAADIEKHYPGVRALAGVTFEVEAGEVHALIGENGAGKSTLIKIITGAVTPDAGTLSLDGELLVDHNPQTAKARGIAAIYQQPALFGTLTVAENLALGLEGAGLWRRVDWRERRRRAQELLDRVGARIDPDALAGSLSMPEQQLVEIARALGAKARVLILDEPTACLPEGEVERLFALLAELKAAGVGLIYISHRLDELAQLADRVTVLRDGQYVTTRAMSQVDKPELIRLMVGRELSGESNAPARPAGAPLLQLSGLGCAVNGVHDVDLTIRRGEILGLAGLVGSGRTELARILFGLTPADAGTMAWDGQPVRLETPAQAMAQGIAYVPEDRRRHGVVGPLSVTANTALTVLDRLAKGGLVDARREEDLAVDLGQRLDLRAASIHTTVGTLSGGNQQKVALARWLAAEPELFIVDEPTQGIDVGAKSEIHRILGDLAAAGKAVLVVSSDMPEVLAVSDRVAVMREGTVVGTLARGEATQERILALALGGAEVVG
ncbi:MAG: sugar ABC transporter ATP-binding protein [Armatimonadetes bacterium]|nr:sugar ABC transporter ATP-binding protein [Armatimonadota bacterium]